MALIPKILLPAVNEYPLYSNSDLSRRFSETFSDCTLAEILSDFSLPISMGELKQIFMDEDVCIIHSLCKSMYT